MNFDPTLIYDVDNNTEGNTIYMPEYQAVSIAAPGATEPAEAVFPFFDPETETPQLAFGWRYPVGTKGGYSGQDWRECACCNRDYGSDSYQIINGLAYCIPHGCLQQKLAQLEEGGPLFEDSTIPDDAINL
jgi:hypothetical protein